MKYNSQQTTDFFEDAEASFKTMGSIPIIVLGIKAEDARSVFWSPMLRGQGEEALPFIRKILTDLLESFKDGQPIDYE